MPLSKADVTILDNNEMTLTKQLGIRLTSIMAVIQDIEAELNLGTIDVRLGVDNVVLYPPESDGTNRARARFVDPILIVRMEYTSVTIVYSPMMRPTMVIEFFTNHGIPVNIVTPISHIDEE